MTDIEKEHWTEEMLDWFLAWIEVCLERQDITKILGGQNDNHTRGRETLAPSATDNEKHPKSVV